LGVSDRSTEVVDTSDSLDPDSFLRLVLPEDDGEGGNVTLVSGLDESEKLLREGSEIFGSLLFDADFGADGDWG
jgi:hypothetical protein